MAYFGLYEANDEDATFVLVDRGPSYTSIDDKTRERQKIRMDRERGPIAEQRIVPVVSPDELPLHAELDELLALIRKNNELFP